jgi:transposase InsO family protein
MAEREHRDTSLLPLDDDPRAREALFRLSVIAELVTCVLGPGELTAAVRELAARRWITPRGCEATLSERTVWQWLRLYRGGGLAALMPAIRSDAGTVKILSPDAIAFAADLRREDRGRSAALVLDMLERAGKVERGAVARQTIDRVLRGMGLGRIRPGTKASAGKVRRRIEVSGPNALWVGDYHDPVAIPLLGEGGTLRCHVSAFIDHWSRFVPYAAYYASQAIYTLEDSFKKAILRAGKPDKVYVDNAKIYRSTAFAFACDRIESKLVHSKAYESEGRGVIERLWGDGLIDTFEREVVHRGVRGLDELNRLLWAWLDEHYHRRPHGETGAAPLARREGFTPVFPGVEKVAELFLVAARRKVDRKYSTVSVDGVTFHVDPALRGKLVRVHYDPHDLSSAVIYFDGRRIQRAPRAAPNVAPPTPPSPAPVRTGFDYLGQVLLDHECRRLREARPIAFADIEPARGFDLADFERRLEVALTHPLNDDDRRAARGVFERFGPLSEPIVTLALERAQTARGRGLHITVYLDFVRTFHLEKGGTP